MRSGTVTELPSPPEGKTGWPWSVGSSPFPNAVSDHRPLPRVSVVTPSYNQAQFLEETIRSVLLQGYPNLEYIIIDGGSTDGSVEIIRKYKPWLAYSVSEPDEGQVFAIVKGWEQSSGEIMAYLNSDDTYLPGAITNAVNALELNPEAGAVCGRELRIDDSGMVISERFVSAESITLLDLLLFNFVPQPATFLRRSALEQAGGLDTRFQLVFDFELWTRVACCRGIKCIPEVLATTRWHSDTKTLTQRPAIAQELTRVVTKTFESPYGSQLSPKERRLIRAKLNCLFAAIYLENPCKHGFGAVVSALAAILNWPLITPRLLRLFFFKAIFRPTVSLLVSLKHACGFEARAERRRRIHWSDWKQNWDVNCTKKGS